MGFKSLSFIIWSLKRLINRKQEWVKCGLWWHKWPSKWQQKGPAEKEHKSAAFSSALHPASRRVGLSQALGCLAYSDAWPGACRSGSRNLLNKQRLHRDRGKQGLGGSMLRRAAPILCLSIKGAGKHCPSSCPGQSDSYWLKCNLCHSYRSCQILICFYKEWKISANFFWMWLSSR